MWRGEVLLYLVRDVVGEGSQVTEEKEGLATTELIERIV
jgi:hypothetical protein